MLITFADSLVGKTVEIGIGGTSSFKMDWGDGVMKDYDGADYFSGTLQSTTLKVYGDGIMICLPTIAMSPGLSSTMSRQ